MQLEIEREALKKEKDAASRDRLGKLEQELANLREQRNGLEAQIQRERQELEQINQIKEQIEQTRAAIERAQREYDYNKAAELQYGTLAGLEKRLHDAEALLAESTNALLRQEVGEQDIAEIISKWTGVPVSKLLEGEIEKLLKMEERLHQRVIGQEEAVAAVANAVRRSRAGLQDPHRPLGSFLFLGPTGVGKTELARALAEFLFDDEAAMIRIDMSEYQEKHTVARLIGAPPGYIGYDEGGQLTEAVRRKPYSVVLFDEIEKANPDVFNVLLQLLDDGRLTDGQGRVVNFRNVVVIMTSNIASDKIQDMTRDGIANDEIRDAVLEELRGELRPEFLNRIDETIVFKPLTRAQIGSIVEIQLGRLRKLLADRKITIELTPAARSTLAEAGYDPVYGARPLKRAIQSRIQNPLATRLLQGDFRPGDTILIDSGPEGLIFSRA
jgi:ATP-dependent Clp protease ATP-binding subunit ClpB